MDCVNDEIEVFLNKLDAFAQGLSETEQAMLHHLVQDEPDDDVVGFNLIDTFPTSVRDVAPKKIGDFGSFLSSGHATGSNIKGFTAPGDVAGFHGVPGTGKV